MNNQLAEKLLHNKMCVIGGAIVIAVVLIAIFSPIIITCDPEAINLNQIGLSAKLGHIFGTDDLGRDIFSRVVAGAKTSLLVGLFVTVLSTALGTLIGSISGFIGGKIDNVTMKVMDIIMAFPSILLALVFVTIMGTGLYSAMTGVGISNIPRFARLVRGSVLSIKKAEYVEAEYAVGQKPKNILIKHILPNCIAPIIVQATLAIGNAIITVAGLGFLGLGAAPGVAEWGAMLSDARNYLRAMPQIAIYPGSAIAITVLGFNLLGDGLRDVLDVRQE